ncbi:MAG: Nramp family divalent metal transporter [Saprospiraceae bacterium]|nr:Nramp family divalent metal transporter [Saprospiraceae bacterium]
MKKLLESIGPGIITAALVFGPGSLTVNTKLGSNFGYALIWVIVISIFLMISFTRLSARIGLREQASLMEMIRRRYGQIWAVIIGIGIFLITSSFQAGNSIGAGIAFAELFAMSATPWIIFFSLGAISLLFFKSFYRILEKIMIGLVIIMLVSFFLTLLLSGPSLKALFSGFIPSIPSGSELLTIALVASSFSIVGAFYQAYLVQEKGWTVNDERRASIESRNGIIILGLLSAMVMMCAASVLHGNEIDVKSASDLGLALEPLLGKSTTIVFMIGFFAASFSSLIGNATIGGTILADAFGMGRRLRSWPVRSMIILVIVMGSTIAILFGRLPLELIVFAQAITIVIAPAAATFLLLLDKFGREKTVNEYVRSNPIPILGLLVLLSLAVYNVNKLLL